jgi:hypothetical protein
MTKFAEGQMVLVAADTAESCDCDSGSVTCRTLNTDGVLHRYPLMGVVDGLWDDAGEPRVRVRLQGVYPMHSFKPERVTRLVPWMPQ